MNWKEFLKPTIAKILITVLIVAILCYFFLPIFLTEPWWRWVIAIIFWYLVSCLIDFVYKKLKKKKEDYVHIKDANMIMGQLEKWGKKK
jgi:4-hydroxybenzoate polyprenyltransferase